MADGGIVAKPELQAPQAGDLGTSLHALVAQLYPICRSITGPGVRQTLDVLSRAVPVERQEVPSGTSVFDWEIPPEWTIRDAYVKNAAGERVIDFRAHNLHVLNYSIPVHARMTLAELKPYLFTDPAQPGIIPYRTSYYAPRWGFCLEHDRLQALPDGTYEVCVDSTLAPGSLTYGEYFHPGTSGEEVLFSAHICHPSLANDNCSGLAILAHLARHLSGRTTRYGYRFVFAPGTIGSLAWLQRNEDRLDRIRHGLVVSCLGDGGGPSYKRSRRGDADIDRIMAHVVRRHSAEAVIEDFSPYGYDERQYCSPGFDLPVGLFQRSRFGRFPEYHTSGDNLDFVRPEHLAQSFAMLAEAIDIIEADARPVSRFQKGEPQLGRRGLYASSIGGDSSAAERNMAMLWVLNLADGRHSLIDMAERSGLPFQRLAEARDLLAAKDMLE